MIPTIGRIVHYKPDSSDTFTAERPAMIVRVWPGPDDSPSTAVQLQVFIDGSNDGGQHEVLSLWKTSRVQGHEPGEWHAFDDCKG